MLKGRRLVASTLIGSLLLAVALLGAPVALAAASGQVASPPTNLPFLFAAYTLTWLLFFGYTYWSSRKQFELERQVHELRKQLDKGSA